MPVFDLLIEADVHELRKHLPGNIRQQIKRAIDDLAHEPRPPRSRALDVTDLDIAPQIEIRRLRLDPYRIVYALSDQENWFGSSLFGDAHLTTTTISLILSTG
jgi:mRNA-degrading endonuclease RelE of RelBE toxin-antitoxin system